MVFDVPPEFLVVPSNDSGLESQPTQLNLQNYRPVPIQSSSSQQRSSGVYSSAVSVTVQSHRAQEDICEDSLVSLNHIEEEIVAEEVDSFLQTKTSMRFEHVKPDLEKHLEVYSYKSQGQMVEASFANSIKIATKKQIGAGGQAAVFECLFSCESEQATLCVDKLHKVFNNEQITNQKFQEMYKEFMIGCSLQHPGVVRYLYFIRQNSRKHGAKEQEFHILLEFCQGGNLEQYLSSLPDCRVADPNRVKSIVGQIAEVLVYLHSKSIVHQDLKPQNVLFNEDRTQLKLCDFGISNKVEQTRATVAARSGSIRYMAPEQLDDQLSPKTDVWALGCILLSLVSGKLPYQGLQNEFKIMTQTCSVGPLEYALQNGHLSEPLDACTEEFLRLCLQTDVKKRATAEQLLRHKFLS